MPSISRRHASRPRHQRNEVAVKVRPSVRRIAPLAIGVGISVVALSGTAGAAPTLPQPNQSGHSAIECAAAGIFQGLNPGQAFLFTGAAGPNRLITPAAAAQLFGFLNLGQSIDFFCTTPAE
jgi:hypothetical protein